MHRPVGKTSDAQQRLRRDIEEAVSDALAKLRLVARGEDNFMSDHELRACMALARMTRLVIVKIEQAPARACASGQFTTGKRAIAGST